ncbi:hypothetical protein BU16DRAFT_522397 [Lophium mytilinum]|uniref:DUF1772-domain-containing protein n=1 Tax=Lophium mytilinum TaxID=390894 RepID=A0A6A6R9D6_9PEZI|nr:hypothetical protein BU16DRAFT_522397 [Lophium mytilinum]
MSLKLLRLLPLLSQTLSVGYAIDEIIFLGTWMQPSLRARTNANLPPWFKIWVGRGVWPIMLGYPFTWTVSGLNFLFDRSALSASGAATWYAAGALLSAAHMLYGKKALGLLDDISNDVPKGNSAHSMEVWLKMHWQRTLLTDLPAWICFVVGFLSAHEAA